MKKAQPRLVVSRLGPYRMGRNYAVAVSSSDSDH